MTRRDNVMSKSTTLVRIRLCEERIRRINMDVNLFERMLAMRKKALRYEREYLLEIKNLEE